MRKFKIVAIIKKIPAAIHHFLWYKPTADIMEGLTFKTITRVYSKNQYREFALLKSWRVAVKTVMPDEQFEDHVAWMLHIQLEHVYTCTVIAELEHLELRKQINAYKEVGVINRKTIAVK